MATNTNIFTDKETNNWFKACIALNVTKEGLTNFVETEIKHVHNSIGKSCGNCCTQNLVRCPTKGICKKSRNCNYHTQTKQPRQCPVKLCELVAKNVTSLHRYNGPSWFNTKAELWSTDHWQIAKCFFPPDGYINVSSIHDTDFNGVISVLLNCKHFDSCISFTIAPKPPAPECLLSRARQIGRVIRHTTNCKVTDAELLDFLQTLDTLLADPKCLAHDPTATGARTKLLNLQKDRLSLTELGELLKEANQTVIQAKETGERFSENAERTLTVGLQTLEAAILAGENRLESKAQDMIVRIQQAANEKEKEDYERAVADLLSRLVEYYCDTVSYVPLSTLNQGLDKHVHDIYVTPKIHRINIENDGRCTKKEQILTYRDCFCRSDHLSRRTYLQGEPGSGKTSFAAKLVYDWCNVHGHSTESEKEQTAFGDVDILHKFKFLFFISLRDSRNHTYVTHMIKTQLIYKIYAEDEWERAYQLVLKIMKNVMYLVVQDGLDEWPCEHAVPSMDGIPKDHCVVLTTSRPLKLADERIKNSQIDILLEVEGISDPEEFNEKLLRCLLDKRKNLKETVKQFQTFLKGRGLEWIASSPMLNTLVLCTWVDYRDESLTGSSLCELYTTMLENLCKKANSQIGYFDRYHPSPVYCFSGTKYVKPNIENIDSIAKAAFSFLFSNEKESSLVFSDIDLSAHLSETAKQFALDSGILSKRKGKRCTDQTLSFFHKTIQEFLTAFHIHRNADVIDDVISGYLKRHDNSYRDIYQMFIFLCGFNISAANKLSTLMNELDVNCKYYSNFQNCITSGYKEAVANTNSPIHLHLSHFDFERDNADDLIQIWTLNTSRARSLKVGINSFLAIHVTIRSQDASSADCHGPGFVSLHARQDPDVANRDNREEIRSSISCIEFDLSSCHNLERIELCDDKNVTVPPNALMGLKKLKHLTLACKWEALDLSSCNNLERLELSGRNLTVLPNALMGLKKLKDLKMHCECEALDFSSYNNLERLELCGRNLTVLPNALMGLKKLKHLAMDCECEALDLSSCNNLKRLWLSGENLTVLPNALVGLKKLKHLEIDCECEALDLSSCNNLEGLTLIGMNLTVLPNALMGLKKLKHLTMDCECEALDLSSCNNLERLELSGENLTVQPNTLVGLKKLEHLTMNFDCQCEALDLSHFVHIKSICISDYMVHEVHLLPLSINNYRTLKCIEIHTTYDGLDLSMFVNLNSISISNEVEVLPKPLLIHNKLTSIELRDFDFKDFVYNNDIDTWCLLNGADPVECADYTPVLPSIQYINLCNVKCSSTWLHSLVSTMLTLDHRVYCELSKCNIASDDYEELLSSDMSCCEEDEDSDMSLCTEDEDSDMSWCEKDAVSEARIITDLNNTCIFDIHDDSPGIWGTLHDMNVKNLSLEGLHGALKVHLVSFMSESLASLTQLETLTMHLYKYLDLQLPPSLKHLTACYDTLSLSELRHLVNKLCAITHSVECRLEFLCCNNIENNTITNIPPEEYIPIEQELKALEHVEVQRFRIYDRIPNTHISSCAAWSVRDSVVNDVDHGDTIGEDEFRTRYFGYSDIEKWHGECLNRISLQLQINCENAIRFVHLNASDTNLTSGLLC